MDIKTELILDSNSQTQYWVDWKTTYSPYRQLAAYCTTRLRNTFFAIYQPTSTGF